MALGPVVFDLAVNPQSWDENAEMPFAKHDVVGSPPVYEYMGDGEGGFKIEGVLNPIHFGGLGGLAALEQARVRHVPLPLMRGDYVSMGWVLIKSLTSQHSDLDAYGVGGLVTFSVGLIKTSRPGQGSITGLLRLFL